MSAVNTMISAIPRLRVFVARGEDKISPEGCCTKTEVLHTFVGPLLQLLELSGTLDEIENLKTPHRQTIHET